MSKFTSLLDNEEKKLNDEQRAVVFADKNCVVSAGAGSGKTAVLTERVIRKLKSGISIKNMLILTYTNISENFITPVIIVTTAISIFQA